MNKNQPVPLSAICTDCGAPLARADALCPACGREKAGEGAAPCLDVYASQGDTRTTLQKAVDDINHAETIDAVSDLVGGLVGGGLDKLSD